MSIWHAMILGIVQGITEFLPISSQAHLLLVPYFLKWNYQGLGFDIGLHWGTLVAVLLVFWKDYWKYLKALFTPLPNPPHQGEGNESKNSSPLMGEDKGGGDKKMAWFLIIATIPAAVAGYLFEKQAETILRNPLITVFTLVIFSFLLWLADRKSADTGGMTNLTWLKSLFIGLFQAIAIIPGVSRSGATMTAGMFSGMNRKDSARFSFLLSGPIIFGAGLVALKDFVKIDTIMIAGFLASALAGFAAIKFLLNYLAAHNFSIFVWYRLALAASVLMIFLTR
jgi:undecaprenyl-diphosphatase